MNGEVVSSCVCALGVKSSNNCYVGVNVVKMVPWSFAITASRARGLQIINGHHGCHLPNKAITLKTLNDVPITASR